MRIYLTYGIKYRSHYSFVLRLYLTAILTSVLALSLANAAPVIAVPDTSSNANNNPPHNNAFHWPNGTRAAVSLSYDDTLNSQLDNAIPALDKYNFKASFYLFMASPVTAERLSDWRAIAKNGHELGNHTINHGCRKSQPNHDWVDVWNDLDKRTVAEMQREIKTASAYLTAIDGIANKRTFTAPCGEVQVSDGDYTKGIQADFIAIKSGISANIQPRHKINPYAVNLYTPYQASGQELIAFVKRAAEQGSIANITFHGIGGDHMFVSLEAHAELLRYLDAHRDIYWVDTFVNIMTHFKKEQHKL